MKTKQIKTINKKNDNPEPQAHNMSKNKLNTETLSHKLWPYWLDFSSEKLSLLKK